MASKLTVQEIESPTGVISLSGNSKIDMGNTNTFLDVPAGTSDQRGTPEESALRWNYDYNNLEIYDGNSWKLLDNPYDGNNIVKSGLILNFDAANFNSYPKSGLNWYDISGYNLTGTLQFGPVYSDEQLGTFNFDGGDDKVYVTVPNVNTTAGGYNTVEFWMKWNGTRGNSGGFPMEFSNYRLWHPFDVSNAMGFNNGAGDCYGFNDSIIANVWAHVVAVFYNGPYTNNSKIYVNGVEQTLSQLRGGATSGTAASQVTIAGYRAAASYSWPGKISVFRIYNRQLSITEIQQNFNALRERFGI